MPLHRTSVPPGWFPKRGDICLFMLDKKRPALVISSDALNRHALDVCIVPISTVEHKTFRLRLSLRAGEGGLDRDSWAKCDQVTTIERQGCCIRRSVRLARHRRTGSGKPSTALTSRRKPMQWQL